jgi:ParB-like chromosome segregation protein Spo0J
MITREMPFEEIDCENEVFRISEELNSDAILNSIREVGQLNPIVLISQGKRKSIVCGFRRVRAMQKLGTSRAVVHLLPKDCTQVRAFNIALWDNLAHRQLNPLEKARVLSSLRDHFGVRNDSILRDYMTILDLHPAEQVLRSFLRLHEIRPALRMRFAEGRLTHNSLDALATRSATVQDSLAALMGKIRLSASLQKKFLELLEDLAAAAGIQPDGLLNTSEIIEAAEDSCLSPFQRGEKIYEILYRRRNPRLSQAGDQFLDQLKQLQLPAPIRIRAHPFFEEPGLHVEFDAPDAEHFRHLAAALLQTAGSTEFEDLFVVK